MDNKMWMEREVIRLLTNENTKCLQTILECTSCIDKIHIVLSAMIKRGFDERELQDLYRTLTKHEVPYEEIN